MVQMQSKRKQKIREMDLNDIHPFPAQYTKHYLMSMGPLSGAHKTKA